jgi:hypothetical protein
VESKLQDAAQIAHEMKSFVESQKVRIMRLFEQVYMGRVTECFLSSAEKTMA